MFQAILQRVTGSGTVARGSSLPLEANGKKEFAPHAKSVPRGKRAPRVVGPNDLALTILTWPNANSPKPAASLWSFAPQPTW